MDALEYKPVSPDYKKILRVDILINWGLLIVAVVVASHFVPSLQLWHGLVVSAVIVTVMLILAMVWVPRRYRLTGYVVQPLEVHFRTGALWRTQTAVAVNRIQHVEITQGPLERFFKLAKLVIYTAGGSGSDLAVPGLPQQQAEQIRDQLLQRISEEEVEPDAGV